MELIALILIAIVLIALANRLLGIDPLVCVLVATVLIVLIYGVPHFGNNH